MIQIVYSIVFTFLLDILHRRRWEFFAFLSLDCIRSNDDLDRFCGKRMNDTSKSLLIRSNNSTSGVIYSYYSTVLIALLCLYYLIPNIAK